MTHAIVPVAAWSLGWLYTTAGVSFIGSICLLADGGPDKLSMKDPNLLGRAVCIVLSILAIVGLSLTSHIQNGNTAFSLALAIFIIQAWKAYDLIVAAGNGSIVVAKWRTFVIVSTSLVTALCASVLAFA